MVVERAYSQLAGRMRCLRCVDLDVQRVPDLVLTCCIVHNVYILEGDVLEENDLHSDDDDSDDEDDLQGQSDNQLRREGAARRSEIVAYFDRSWTCIAMCETEEKVFNFRIIFDLLYLTELTLLSAIGRKLDENWPNLVEDLLFANGWNTRKRISKQ